MKNLHICLLLILLIYIAIAKPVFAQSIPQQFLDVSPVIEDLHLIPGQPTSYPLTITNKGDKPVGFHIDVTGIDPTADSIQDYSHLTSSFLSWISVTPADLIVAPHDKNTFTVTINTPKNAKNSGYYATLFLTPFISNALPPQGPVILERIGTLLLTTVGNLNYEDLVNKVHITDFTYSPKQITFTVKNSYFTHFIAKPHLSFTSTLDKQSSLWPEEKHVLPGSSRTWALSVNTPWYTLYNQVNLTVSIGDGKQLNAQATYVNYPFILEIVIGVCLMLLLIKRTKQLIKALKILFTGKE